MRTSVLNGSTPLYQGAGLDWGHAYFVYLGIHSKLWTNLYHTGLKWATHIINPS